MHVYVGMCACVYVYVHICVRVWMFVDFRIYVSIIETHFIIATYFIVELFVNKPVPPPTYSGEKNGYHQQD